MSERNVEKRQAKEEVVFALVRPSRCYGCDRKLPPGEIVKLQHRADDREALCRRCARIEHLEIVPRGNARVTRLASKYSSVRLVIMKWSEIWKCYEREGLLLEREAVERARAEAAQRS